MDQAPRVAQGAADNGAGRRARARRPDLQEHLLYHSPDRRDANRAHKSSITKGATIMERREVLKTMAIAGLAAGGATELATSHDAMVMAPEELTRMLIGVTS